MDHGRTSSAAALDRLVGLIEDADRHGPVEHPHSAALAGLSGRKTVGLLQRLAVDRQDRTGECYAEIGVFQGLTLLSVALAAPRLSCIGIDDFSILDPAGENLAIVRRRIADCAAGNVTLVNADYEAALAAPRDWLGGRRIGIYFVDGAHDYRSQLLGVMLGLPCLADDAVIVIDDANYAFVRRSTCDFLLTHRDWRLLFEAYSPGHPANLDKATLAHHEAGWLNGIHVLARDPARALPDMLPPVSDDRDLFVNDWLVHRHGLAPLAPEALALARAVCAGDRKAEDAERIALLERHGRLAQRLARSLPDRNTDSAGLTAGRFNRRAGG